MGCKRHACEVNKDKKLKQLIIDGADSVKFLNGGDHQRTWRLTIRMKTELLLLVLMSKTVATI